MSVDFATFTKVAPHVTAVKKPVLLRGRHGIGKSCVVYQTAAGLNLPVVERRASQMTEGDLVGLPIIDGECTRFNPPDWFHQACNEAVVLFLDEVDRATIEVRQGIFELTDSRKLNGHVLHADTLIFAAVNGGEHGEQYQVGEMDPAELDRWTVFDVEPTIEDWLTWAKENVTDVVWNFINQNRKHLEHTTEFEPNKVYPSRRSWDRLNECLETAGFLTEENRLESLPLIYELTTAFVGSEAASMFRDFCEKYENQVLVEDILDNGDLDKVKDFGINDHSAFVDKMESAGVFDERLSDNQIQNLTDYFVILPSEVAVVLFALLGNFSGTDANGGKDGSPNIERVHGCQPTNKPEGWNVGLHIAELLTGNSHQ